MGGCCSCCDSEGTDERETEMQGMSGDKPTKEQLKALVVSRSKSSPTIQVKDGRTQVTGHGLALCAVSIEQDAAYWEWHIQIEPGTKHIDDILFGVATNKNRGFYKKMKDEGKKLDSSSEDTGTQWMRKIEVQNGDVVGVAVQQSDLPMVQFFLNGEALYDCAINRFRGTVYPSICLPEMKEDDETKVMTNLILIESDFKQISPGPRFGPVIVARSIV
mmetsp:Transcript_23756/g.66342  ORF Transcript_23756/g.66342 Transcript_23756/m.66342 type:complete len:218 (-) Transcript_23756:259-912(-)|eukprot:CAMPEP_0198115048 /NCGR_PEP_ID=MMETSP1442-20131203/6251_1 /TAXON_ID= /ORGANISM="Craspedostauros australis, Strain CCMP3328" /LENGTH=217 /DNA_ID=CAMNT_0043772475 /DNA_START=169 /DNA_END=822 /DNA_ORIENTATION=+